MPSVSEDSMISRDGQQSCRRSRSRAAGNLRLGSLTRLYGTAYLLRSPVRLETLNRHSATETSLLSSRAVELQTDPVSRTLVSRLFRTDRRTMQGRIPSDGRSSSGVDTDICQGRTGRAARFDFKSPEVEWVGRTTGPSREAIIITTRAYGAGEPAERGHNPLPDYLVTVH